MIFRDRRDAALLLANKISKISIDKSNTIVIALTNSGVLVAIEIAKKLQIPLDLFFTKNIGAPTFPELVVASVSEDNEVQYNKDLIEKLGNEISDLLPFKELGVKELQKMRSILSREYPRIPIDGKNIILVDDGIVTGNTMAAVIQFLKKKEVGKIIVASPVSSQDAMTKLEKQVDRVEVVMAQPVISNVGEYYKDFPPVETEEIIDLLCELSCQGPSTYSEDVNILDTNITLAGRINTTEKINSWIILADSTVNPDQSLRNSNIALELASAGHATLRCNLLTENEDTYGNRCNIPLLSKRLIMATAWLKKSKYYQKGTPIGYYGTGTDAVATLFASTQTTDSNLIYAIVSRAGQLDMVDKQTLGSIYVPILLLLNEEELELIELNKEAAESLPNCRLNIVSLDAVPKTAIEWFNTHLPSNTAEDLFSMY